ncbi:Flagellar protein FliS [compost metagenome]
MITLDMKVGGEIAQNLFDLYDFMSRETVEANVNKNARRLEGVIEIFKELREAWMQAAKNVAALKTAQAIA